MENEFDTYISIDPGISGGGIVSYRKGVIKPISIESLVYTEIKKPKCTKEQREMYKARFPENFIIHMKHWLGISNKVLCFIEKVNTLRPEDVEKDPFRAIVMQKLIKHHSDLLTALSGLGISYVQVHPISWTNGMGLVKRGVKESDTERKNRYKVCAKDKFPHINVTGWNQDALLILYFGLLKLNHDPAWIEKNIIRKTTNLFT